MAYQSDFESSPANREQLFIKLYKKAFPAVAKYVSKRGGSFDEAKDIFQDALIVYYEKAACGAMTLHVNEQAYLLGIAKHLWSKKFAENNMIVPLDEYGKDLGEDIDCEPSSGKLMHYLETTGQKCMEILKAFYYDNLPVNKIAELFGYSGVRSATVQKYKCMERVRETIKERSLAYEDFIE
jgi:DNA-directed RNA polymerase specialized sigma24 family protein